MTAQVKGPLSAPPSAPVALSGHPEERSRATRRWKPRGRSSLRSSDGRHRREQLTAGGRSSATWKQVDRRKTLTISRYRRTLGTRFTLGGTVTFAEASSHPRFPRAGERTDPESRQRAKVTSIGTTCGFQTWSLISIRVRSADVDGIPRKIRSTPGRIHGLDLSLISAIQQAIRSPASPGPNFLRRGGRRSQRLGAGRYRPADHRRREDNLLVDLDYVPGVLTVSSRVAPGRVKVEDRPSPAHTRRVVARPWRRGPACQTAPRSRSPPRRNRSIWV
jgi:hypothetical protein